MYTIIYIWSVIVSYLRRMRNIVFGGFARSVPFVYAVCGEDT